MRKREDTDVKVRETTAYWAVFIESLLPLAYTAAMFGELNEKQKEAVYAGSGPLLVVAGAGSGKTRTLTSRLARLIADKEAKPEQILAITFTNKAADEMKSRVEQLLKREGLMQAGHPFVGTFHSFGASVLRSHAALCGRTPSFSIYDGDDAMRVVRKIVRLSGGDTGKAAVAKVGKAISRIKSELVDAHTVQGWGNGLYIWDMFRAYERALEEQNAFDFDDLIAKVVSLFRSHPEILAHYQSLYEYVLVDEYQDVNTAQYMLVRLLVGEKGNVTAVGDDQQAIYRFRFSDFRNFLNFERDWPSARVVLLEQNYRSTKHIIESSSALIAHNSAQKKKTLWTDNREGEPIRVVAHENEFEEALFVADTIENALSSHRSVGVLYRTNAQSRALEQILLERDISFNLFGAVGFYDRKEIKDIIAALRIAHNPSDAVSYERLEKVFYKRLTASLVDDVVTHATMEPAHLINRVLEKTDYLARLEKEYVNVHERLENLHELIRFASHFDTLGAFLEKISLAHPFDETTKKRKKGISERGAYLMTIHLAKGLEFDEVIVAGVNEGLLPHQRSLFSADDMEEERRLMYVSMTRARSLLTLSFWGVASRFLYELPPERLAFRSGELPDEEEQYIEYD